MRKISSKIALSIAACSFIIAILLGSTSIIQSSKYIKTESEDKLQYMANNYANKSSMELQTVESITKTFSTNIISTLDIEKLKNDPEYMNYYLNTFIAPTLKHRVENVDTVKVMSSFFYFNPKLSGKAGDVWYLDENGSGTYERQDQLEIEVFDPNDESMKWFYDVSKKGSTRWGDPYIWEGLDQLIVPFSMAVYKGDTFIGVAGMDITFEQIENSVNNMKVYQSGYAFLLNSNYDILIHPNFETGDNLNTVLNGDLKVVTDNMSKKQSGVVEYNLNGSQKLLAFSHLSNGWILAVAPPLNEIFEPIDQLKIFIIILTIIGIGLSILLALFIGKSISKPIVKVTELLNKTKNFDLANNDDLDKLTRFKDETGIMIKAMDSLRNYLRTFGIELTSSSKVIEDNANKVEDLTIELNSQATDTSATTEELSAAMEETAAAAEEINATASEIEIAINSISQKAEEGASLSTKISSRADNLKESAISSADKAQDVYKEVKKEMDEAIKQANAVEKINLLADTILQITDQTNLLALNAAVEAARAGEAGKGFAVVADEIRKLAEQSSKAITDIQGVVEIVNSSVTNLIGSSQKILNFVEKDVNTDYEQLIEVGEKYSEDAKTFNNFMTTFNSTSKQLKSSTENMVTAINQVSITINESASGVDDIAMKTSNLVEKLVNIKEYSNDNLDSAKKLKDMVSKFKL